MTHIEDVLLWAIAEEGHAYEWGGKGDPLDPSPAALDCSGLTKWACDRAGVTPELPGGAYWQYKHCDAGHHRTLLEVDQALEVRGALLFVLRRDPPHVFDDVPHVAISLGDGTTVEARGRAWGIGTWASAHRFQAGARIPGVDYSAGHAPLPPPQHPRRRPMQLLVQRNGDPGGAVFLVNEMHRRWLDSPERVDHWQRVMETTGYDPAVQRWDTDDVHALQLLGPDPDHGGR